MITGNIPLRSKSFKSNPKVLALSSAFAGGLFLSVGLLHLLPEANENIQASFQTSSANDDEEQSEDGNDDANDDDEHFPWAFFITGCSFALILFIEKIATDHHHADEHGHSMIKKSILSRAHRSHA